MSEVGHSFSTMLSRMGNIKLSRLDSFNNGGEDLNNVETVLRNLGVSLRDSNGQFKNFGDVLDTVAAKWSSYNSVQQRALATAFASKTNMEDFFVLMQNYSTATDYATVAMNSAGTATEKFANYQDSIVAKQKELTANYEAFSSTILDSDLIKGTYDTGSGILGFFTEMAKTLGAFPTLATTAMGALSLKMPNTLASTGTGLGFSDSLKNLFKKPEFLKMADDKSAIQYLLGYEKALKSGADSALKFQEAHKDNGLAAFVANTEKGQRTVAGYQQFIGSTNQALSQMSLKAKIASAGMKALSVAMNMALSFGIAIAIQAVVSGITSLANAQKDAIDKAKELSTSWADQSTKLKDTKSKITEISDEFGRLGKGVDSLGNNISLNADEFSRYNEIANEIASLFPEMVSGWTLEGNAILKTKGNVEALTQAYKNAEKAANDTIIRQSSDVFKGTSAATGMGSGWFQPMFSSNASRVLLGKNLLEYINSGNKDRVSQVKGLEGYKDIISDLGLSDTSVETLMKNGSTVASYIRSLQAELNSYSSQVTPIIEAYLSQDEQYGKLSSDMKDVVSSIISSFDYEFLNQFQGSVPRLMTWVNSNVVDALSNSDIPTEIANMLTLQGKYQKNEISVGAYDSALFGFNNAIRNLTPEVQSQLKELFVPDTDNIVNRTKSLLKDGFEKVGSLTLEDLNIASKLSPKGPVSWDELLSQIAKVKEQSALGIDALNASMTSLTSAQSVSAEVMKSVSETGSISAENYKKLIEADAEYASAIDSSTGLLTVNAQKIDEINKKKAEQLLADTQLAKSKALTEYQTNALELVTKQEMLNKAREQGLDMSQEWIKNLEVEVKSMEVTQDGLEESILGYDRLTGEIQYATSAYKKWIDAQNAPESGDQYRGTVEAIKRMKELLKEGRIGTQEYQAAANYLVPKEVQDQGTKAVQKYVTTLDKYFKDGSTGALQFAKDLAKTAPDIAKFDPKTKQFDLFSTSLSDIADRMGMTEEAAYALFQMLNEFTPDGKGFIFDNPQFDSTEQINAVQAASDAYSKTKEAAEAAQKELDKAKTDAEKAIVQQKVNETTLQEQKAQQDLYTASVSVGQGTKEELTIQQQIDSINKTLSELTIEIPATVKFDSVTEIAKILDPFKDPANQPKVIINGEESESFANMKADLTNIRLFLSSGGRIIITAVKGESYSDMTSAMADQSTLNGGAQVIISAGKDESYSNVTDALSDQSTLNQGASIPLTVTDNATSAIDDVKSDIDGAIKYAEDNPVVITVKAQGGTPNETPKPISNPDELMEFVNGGEWQSPNPEVKPLEDVSKGVDNLSESLGDLSTEANTANESLGQIPETTDETTEKVQEQIPWWKALWNLITGQGQPDVTIDINTDPAKGKIDEFVEKENKRTITLQAKVQTTGIVSFANGTRRAEDELAIVGDSTGDGSEIVNHRKRGFWEYFRKPTLVKLDKGDDVYNNRDTKRMLSGKTNVTGGRSFPTGTTVSGSMTLSGTTNRSRSSSSNSYLKSIENLFDWFEIALESAKKATDTLVKTVQNAVGYIKQNAVLNEAISSTKSEIAKSEQAIAVYQSKADEIAAKTGLSADLVQKIQQGAPELEVIDNEKLKEKIDAYKSWYDRAQSVKDTLVELRAQENELSIQKLDNITKYYDNRIARIDSSVGKSQAQIDNKTATGKQVTASDYSNILSQTTGKIGLLTKERAALNAEFQSLVASGVIKQDSDSWHEYTGQLEELGTAIIQAGTDLQGFKDSVAAIKLTPFTVEMNNLQAASDNLQAMQDLVRTQGGTLTPSSFDSLIVNSKQQIVNLKSQNQILREQQSGLDVMSDKYQEIQSQINGNELAIIQAKTQQEEWNDSIKDIEIEKLQKQRDEIQKTNDAYQKQLDLQQAQEDLARSESQRTKRIFQDGKFINVADQQDIREKQNRADELKRRAEIDTIDKKIDDLEKSKSTNNIYDSNGNLSSQITSIGSTSFATLQKEISSITIADMITANIKQKLPQITPLGAVQSSSPQSLSIRIDNISMSGVNDMQGFVREIELNLPNAFKQKLYTK